MPHVLVSVGDHRPRRFHRRLPTMCASWARKALTVRTIVRTDNVGLGLSIVRSVVRAHGGTVAAQPQEAGGLVVRVELPSRP